MCEHYEDIRVEIFAPCCEEFHACRLCHDAEQLSHTIDRYAIKEVRCTGCGVGPQPKSNRCQGCDVDFAEHFCNQCNLWSNKPIYHCDACRICYLLSPDERKHCDQCNLCYAEENNSTKKHFCPESSVDEAEECCVCLEKLYYGVKTPQRMRCGHSIHTQCMTVLLQNGDFRCPLCKKTTIDMDWDKYGKLLEELTTTITSSEESSFPAKECSVMCNDCLLTATTTTTMTSIYRCGGCGGYNTSLC